MDNGISLSSCISGLACFSQKIQTSEYNIAKSEIETEESMSDNIGSKWPTKAKNLTCTRGQKLWDLILLPIAMAQVSLKKCFISPPPRNSKRWKRWNAVPIPRVTSSNSTL